MDRFNEWPAFQRLDNAAVVDFLTSTASCLAEGGLISAKETDNLRLALSGIQSHAPSRDQPLLLQLAEQKAEFLEVLTARFGTTGYCLNLLKHTLRTLLPETRTLLSQWGEALVKKAELYFNQSFFIYAGGDCEKRVLYSQVLVDFSESLADAITQIDLALVELGRMNPNDMAQATDEDQTIDLAIAHALGFDDLVRHTVAGRGEGLAKRLVSHAILHIAEVASQLAEQLAANSGESSSYAVLAACEWLKAESERLSSLEVPRAGSLMIWELRRRNLASTLQNINEALKLLVSATIEAVSRVGSAQRPEIVPHSVHRRLAFDMIASGVAPSKAWTATRALFRYLDERKLKPNELLPAELSKIDPTLMTRSLELLISLNESDRLMRAAVGAKNETLRRSQQLKHTFTESLKQASRVFGILALLLLSGCGLKTKPASDVVEFRPDIPFRPEEAPRAPKTVDAQSREVEAQGSTVAPKGDAVEIKATKKTPQPAATETIDSKDQTDGSN